FWDYSWRQVFVLRVDVGAGARPAPVQMTRGDYNHADPAWSPDSKTLAFSANRSANADLSNLCDIWLMDSPAFNARGKAKVRAPQRITQSKGPAVGPAFSPDGQQIAFVGHDNRYTRNVTHLRVYVMARDGSAVRCLTESFDEGVGDEVLSDLRAGARAFTLHWSADGETIYFSATEHGASNVYQV